MANGCRPVRGQGPEPIADLWDVECLRGAIASTWRTTTAPNKGLAREISSP
jgi:hypothetical protein